MKPPRVFSPKLLLIVLTLACMSMADPANGEMSVALSPSRISVDAPVGQGDAVRLPSLSVSNRGDESAHFRVEVRSQPGQHEREPAAEWFSITPRQFELGPGDTQIAVVEMVVPQDAPADAYRAVLTAGTSDPDGGQGGAALRAAVGAPLLFEVENRDFNFYDPVADIFQQLAPFSYAILGILVGVAGLSWLRSRYRVGIHVERRQ